MEFLFSYNKIHKVTRKKNSNNPRWRVEEAELDDGFVTTTPLLLMGQPVKPDEFINKKKSIREREERRGG